MAEENDAQGSGDAAAARLNGDCQDAPRLSAALQRMMRERGSEWQALVQERCPHLFADVPVYVGAGHLRQMRAVIAAVEEVANDGKGKGGREKGGECLGVFHGYDFHLDGQGAHLIEVNTNAGGAFLNVLPVDSQRESGLPGTAVAAGALEQVFLDMFLHEWRLEAGDKPLKAVAIVDERPESQYLYPEFLLARQMFERGGITACIVDPDALEFREGGVYCAGRQIDLIYNRLTDFDLQQFPHLRTAWLQKRVVLTPNPAHHARYADKSRLVLFSDAEGLRGQGVSQAVIDVLVQGVPRTRSVRAEDAERWWAERKQWFFKPVSGYGSKGAYRGDKLTRRVFEEIMQGGGYVAQQLVPPGERNVCPVGCEPQRLKYDVRCYVYDGTLQLAAARLYQGQTTNFRTPGGGFAAVRSVA